MKCTPWVFANKYEKPRKANVFKDLSRILIRAGVREKGLWHTVRRAFAIHPLMEKADLESIRQFLGHSDILTTMAYLNVTDKHLDSTVDLIEL